MTSAAFLDPVNRESTPSIIARKLRHAIGHGQLPQGAQLAEAELAKDLGVSRGPLREAMQRLTQEGLLLSIRNRGLFVIELTDDDVRDIYLARSALERAAAERVVGNGDHETASAALQTAAEQMADAASRSDAAGIGEADLAFHEALVQSSRSARLIRMHQTLLTETRMCLNALSETYPEPDPRILEHREIAAALAAGDIALFGRLIGEHMDDAVHRLGPGFNTLAATPDAPAR